MSGAEHTEPMFEMDMNEVRLLSAAFIGLPRDEVAGDVVVLALDAADVGVTDDHVDVPVGVALEFLDADTELAVLVLQFDGGTAKVEDLLHRSRDSTTGDGYWVVLGPTECGVAVGSSDAR